MGDRHQIEDTGLRSSGLRALELDQFVSIDTGVTENLDCSSLGRLSVNSLSFLPFRNAAVRLRGLRSLRVDLDWARGFCVLENFRGFLFTVSALEELDLTGYISGYDTEHQDTGCFDTERNNTERYDTELFEHLGKTLNILRLHERENPSRVCRRRVLRNDEIQHLGRSCRKLQRLGIDLAYNGLWVSLECYTVM